MTQQNRAYFDTTWVQNYLLTHNDYKDLFDSIWLKGDGVLVYSESIIDVSYAELLAIVNSNSLEITKIYRIIDYKSQHLISGHPRGLVANVPNSWNYTPTTCPIEPILVKALSTSTLYKEAYSETYPNDIIHYNVNPTDYDTFGIQTFGKITYRKDTERNVAAYYDWRTFLCGRWETINGSGVYDSLVNTGFGYRNFKLDGSYYDFGWKNVNTISNIYIEPTDMPVGYTATTANNIVFQSGASNIVIQSGNYNLNFLEKINNLNAYSGVHDYSVASLSDNTILQYISNKVTAMKMVTNVQYFTLTSSGNADSMHSHLTYQTQIDNHTTNISNPHQTTKAQVGLGNCDNTSDINKPVSNATSIAINNHTNRTDNPHQTTKAQVGLENCDNTSDTNKPVSNATQLALNSKSDIVDPTFTGDLKVFKNINSSHFFINMANFDVPNNFSHIGIVPRYKDNIAYFDSYLNNWGGYFTWSSGTDVVDRTYMKLCTSYIASPRLMIGNDMQDNLIHGLQVSGGVRAYGNSQFDNIQVLVVNNNSTSAATNLICTNKIVGDGTQSGQLGIHSFLESNLGGGGLLLYGNRFNYTLPQPDDRLGYVHFGTCDFVGNVNYNTASVSVKAEGTWVSNSPTPSLSNHPAYMTFETTPPNPGGVNMVRKEQMRLTGRGALLVHTQYDDTINTVQVSGGIYSSSNITSSTATIGTPTVRNTVTINGGISASGGTYSFGDSVNATVIEADGTIRYDGNATVWKDINFPIIIRTTGIGIPTVATVLGNVTSPQWQVNDYNVCEINEMPHEWKEGSQTTWHVHYIHNTATTGDSTARYVNFELEFVWANTNSVFTTVTASSGDILIPANTPKYTHMIHNISTWTPVGGKIAAHVIPRLKRITSVGTAPSANPWIGMLQMHIECDTNGSRSIITK